MTPPSSQGLLLSTEQAEAAFKKARRQRGGSDRVAAAGGLGGGGGDQTAARADGGERRRAVRDREAARRIARRREASEAAQPEAGGAGARGRRPRRRRRRRPRAAGAAGGSRRRAACRSSSAATRRRTRNCRSTSPRTPTWAARARRGRSRDHSVPQAKAAREDEEREVDLQMAADLAAFYSDLRNERKAEVMFCNPKHISKPRKAPVGAVRVSGGRHRAGRPEDVPGDCKARAERGVQNDGSWGWFKVQISARTYTYMGDQREWSNEKSSLRIAVSALVGARIAARWAAVRGSSRSNTNADVCALRVKLAPPRRPRRRRGREARASGSGSSKPARAPRSPRCGARRRERHVARQHKIVDGGGGDRLSVRSGAEPRRYVRSCQSAAWRAAPARRRRPEPSA